MKAPKWMRRAPLAVLALMFALAGCEGRGESGLLLEPKHESEQVLISWKSRSGYTVVRETEESVGSVEAVIGRTGGKLVLGKHVLIVPAGAVPAGTRFRIEKEDGDHVRLHLTASRFSENDIGRRGFARPVKLILSYEDAANVNLVSASLLQVMYVRPDEKVEALPSTVDFRNRSVATELRHFSEYAIGWPSLF